jgi:peptide/nickel transport system ATP-binding protein
LTQDKSTQASVAAEGGADEPLLVVDGLHTQFRIQDRRVSAVRGVSFSVNHGEILGIVGESGSGKTTLLMSILRLLPPNAAVTAGSVQFAGTDLLSLTEQAMRRLRGHDIALVPQRPMNSLSPVSQIRAQMMRYVDWNAWRDQSRESAIATMLDRVGLRAVRERIRAYPHEFSGGQLQRILIAVAALASRPQLLLADEPTSTLDPTIQAQVLQLLQELRDELGVAVIFVTHDLGAIAQICDRVGVMYRGELVELAAVRPLFADPRHPYTQALLNAIPSRHRPRQPLPTLAGSVADVRDHIEGCAFAPRCPSVMSRCWHEAPEPRQSEASKEVRCHLYPPTKG